MFLKPKHSIGNAQMDLLQCDSHLLQLVCFALMERLVDGWPVAPMPRRTKIDVPSVICFTMADVYASMTVEPATTYNVSRFGPPKATPPRPGTPMS